MELSRLNSPDFAAHLGQLRPLPPHEQRPVQRLEPQSQQMQAVLERTRKYQVQIDMHRLTEVNLNLNVRGGGSGPSKVDMEMVLAARSNPKLSDLHAALADFDTLTDSQRDMVLAAGEFLVDKNTEGYQALVHFVQQAKAHSAAHPGATFNMNFHFKSEQHLQIDYVEEIRERILLTGKGAPQSPGEDRAGETHAARRATVASSRRVVFSLTIEHKSILISLGEVLADLQAGLTPEARTLPKPADATAQLLEELLDPPDAEDLRNDKADKDNNRATPAQPARPHLGLPAIPATPASPAQPQGGALDLTVGTA